MNAKQVKPEEIASGEAVVGLVNALVRKPQHTPGPWDILTKDADSGHIIIHSLDKHGGVVAETSGMFLGDIDGNAQLIAAAPELLDALERLLEMSRRIDSELNPHPVMKDLGEAEEIAERAIKKARGE